MTAPLHSVSTHTGEGTAVSDARASFEGFFQEQHPRLFAALCLTTGSREEAGEIAQEAFVRILERWGRVSSLGDPPGYLFRTAMNARVASDSNRARWMTSGDALLVNRLIGS